MDLMACEEVAELLKVAPTWIYARTCESSDFARPALPHVLKTASRQNGRSVLRDGRTAPAFKSSFWFQFSILVDYHLRCFFRIRRFRLLYAPHQFEANQIPQSGQRRVKSRHDF